MKILIELETNEAGEVIRSRILKGGRKVSRGGVSKLREVRKSDPDSVLLARRFVAEHGVKEAAKLLRVTRGAFYQWISRGSVPHWHVSNMKQIIAEKTVDTPNQ